MENKKAVLISVSSDIGKAMFERWSASGWDVFGTYRTKAAWLREKQGNFLQCDLSDTASVRKACEDLRQACPAWDVLVLCPATQDPVGPFMETDFNDWESSIKINFTSQLRIVRELLPSRRRSGNGSPFVLFFAGGGTNNATVNYSAYTVSKIGLIKMCELLDAEVPDTRFAIVGPGWVKTKIHDATLKAKAKAGDNYKKTLYKLSSDECTPMEQVLDCCDWVIRMPRDVVSGRNFSVVFDKWGSQELEKTLSGDPDMYKLRRHGNQKLVK